MLPPNTALLFSYTGPYDKEKLNAACNEADRKAKRKKLSFDGE